MTGSEGDYIMSNNVYFHTDGMTDTEAQDLRRQNIEIWSCWYCRARKLPRPNWFPSECTIRKGEHIVRCPKHRDEP